MKRIKQRRQFLQSTGIAGVGFWVGTAAADEKAEKSPSPNEKLDIAIIGAGGKGADNLGNVSSENIVALCDPDENRARGAFGRYPKAKQYKDFRRMFDDMAQKIDAVVVSTPDHMHAPASVMAMKLGKHVYCEKPLTHSIHEARVMREVAAQQKVATQMGNQGHSNRGARRAVEVVRAGAIGPVREVHAWTNRPIWPQGIDRPTATPSVPNNMDWYLWLGVAQDRPYHPSYAPFNWRGWWDFGTGALGDMACHILDMAFWSLELENPTAIEAEVSDMHAESPPKWAIIRYEFPARGDLPPCKFTWYDGNKKPPQELVAGEKLPSGGSILVGEKGTMFVPDDYGARFILLPKERFADYKGPEESIPRSPGHHREWLNACKGGPAAMSNFDYASRLTETVLLGNLAVRTGKRIEWDAKNMRVTNYPDANQYVRREYRKGWSL